MRQYRPSLPDSFTPEPLTVKSKQTTKTQRQTTTKLTRLSGFVVWRGPSELDGSPIVCIASCVDKARRDYDKGSNHKTGAMAQLYILRSDCSPVEAKQTGKDISVCGDCIHRKGSCYVRTEQGPLQVYKAFLRGKYPALTLEQGAQALDGLSVRLGAYGDAAALPSGLLPVLLAKASGYTGYTHQWRKPSMAHLKPFCMASCDTPEDHKDAIAQGWRAFTIVPKGYYSSPSFLAPALSFLCPASEEAGKKLTCSDCLACDGTSGNRRASVFIPVHGVAHKQAAFARPVQIDRR